MKSGDDWDAAPPQLQQRGRGQVPYEVVHMRDVDVTNLQDRSHRPYRGAIVNNTCSGCGLVSPLQMRSTLTELVIPRPESGIRMVDVPRMRHGQGANRMAAVHQL